MKLSELQRLTLENLHLKRQILEINFSKLQEELGRIISEYDNIVDPFCKEHNLDKEKIQINLQTGEVILQEGGDAKLVG